MKTSEIIQKNLTAILADKGMKQVDLAKLLGCTETTVSNWCLGLKAPRMNRIDQIAAVLGVTREDLLTENQQTRRVPSKLIPMPEMVRLPVVGKIACGTPILAQENIEAFYQAPKEWRANMYLTCQGDSMEPLIKNGDMVAIREQQDAETDEIVAIMELDSGDGFATLKKLKKRPDRVELWPLNPNYEPIVYLKEEINSLRIIGLAVGIIRRLHE